jgi:hypothetical protein
LICLQEKNDLGYLLPDLPVVEFFADIQKKAGKNDLSLSAQTSIVCFLAAMHSNMLAFLQLKQNCNGKDLLTYWHELMESNRCCADQSIFFEKVVEQTKQVGHFSSSLFPTFMISYMVALLGAQPARRKPHQRFDHAPRDA